MFLSGDMNVGNPLPRDVLVESFAALCERASRHGVTVGLEPCAWSNVGTFDEALGIVAESGADNAGLFLDVWHLYRRDFDFSRLRSIDPALIVGVQIDDALADAQGDLPTDCLDYRALPGVGAAEPAELLANVFHAGVDVPISVEVISIEQRARNLDDAARMSYQAAHNVVLAARNVASPCSSPLTQDPRQ